MASASWERFLALRRAEVETDEDYRSEALAQPIVQTLMHDPDNARAHVRMAAICMRRFEEVQQQGDVPLPLSQIRDAVAASGFDNLEEQNAWLARVTGDNRRWLDLAYFHACRALQLCPLQGEAYTLLAELSFLQGPHELQQQALLQQAMVVRPHDAQVLFAVGRDAALAGDDATAIALWRDAFHRESKIRQQVIAIVGPKISAEEFIGHFEPTKPQMREMFTFYRDVQLVESATAVASRLAAIAEQEANDTTGDAASSLWNDAHRYYAFIGDQPRALACIERSAALAPHNYDFRRSLAAQLLYNNRYDEAIAELRWCRRQKRNDPAVERLWTAALRGPTVDALEETASRESDADAAR